MKYFTVLAVVLLFAALFGSGLARSPQLCGYTDSKGKQVYLTYIGDKYTEVDSNGKCLKKVTCLSDYNIKVEKGLMEMTSGVPELLD